MPFIYSAHRGLAYGDGYMQSDGALGQVVKLVGADLFAVNTSAATKSFGILAKDVKAGEMPTVFCMDGFFETDVFEGTPAPGDLLKVSAAGKLTPGVAEGEEAIARVISLSSGTLKFRLLI